MLINIYFVLFQELVKKIITAIYFYVQGEMNEVGV